MHLTQPKSASLAHSFMHLVFCRNLGEVYGLPKMHYKGKQGDFYIMVRQINTRSLCTPSRNLKTCTVDLCTMLASEVIA